MQTKLDWAEFALEKAQDTKGMKDDIAALKRIIGLIKEQIRQTGLTVDLARALRDKQKELRAALHPSGSAGRRRRPDEIPVGGDFIPARGGAAARSSAASER
jgi:hypothetical protein